MSATMPSCNSGASYTPVGVTIGMRQCFSMSALSHSLSAELSLRVEMVMPDHHGVPAEQEQAAASKGVST